MKSTIDRLIINSPYEESAHYWSYDRETRFFSLKDGRCPAGYIVATENSKAFDDPGKFIEIPLVNKIRDRVKARRLWNMAMGSIKRSRRCRWNYSGIGSNSRNDYKGRNRLKKHNNKRNRTAGCNNHYGS